MERLFQNEEDAMETARSTFLPAAGRHWALPLYDPLVKLIGGDLARSTILELAAPREGQVVLDLGCGTGSLATIIKLVHPTVEVVGLDPDPKALARANRKANRAAVDIRLDRGFAHALPYSDDFFDRVYSSFMFHHLGRSEKEAMLLEARRVVKPGGLLCLLDFDGPATAAHRGLHRWLHSSAVLADNDGAQILTYIRQAGFVDPKRMRRGTMAFGLVAYSCYLAGVPVAEASGAR
jgi:ubiquinone/menaquinone biosynthesis C-methylase UbiE